MQVVGCQLDIAWEDKHANFNRVREMMASIDIEPGAMIVLPELFATGFTMNSQVVAEEPDGPTRQFLAELAASLKSAVVGGVATRGEGGRVYNQALAIGPDHVELARYSKQQPFTPGGEAEHYAAGSECAFFEWREFRIAPFVCYDMRFPETIRPAARHGAEVIVIIANWPDLRDLHWQTLLRARAIESQAFAIGVNRAGRDPRLGYRGHSLIISPEGETLAAAGEGEEVISAELDLNRLIEYRRRFPFLADIRPT